MFVNISGNNCTEFAFISVFKSAICLASFCLSLTKIEILEIAFLSLSLNKLCDFRANKAIDELSFLSFLVFPNVDEAMKF